MNGERADHLADRLLGDDPCESASFPSRTASLISSVAAQATQTKYALVCGGCFRHNGLVGDKGEWENMSTSSARTTRRLYQTLIRVVPSFARCRMDLPPLRILQRLSQIPPIIDRRNNNPEHPNNRHNSARGQRNGRRSQTAKGEEVEWAEA